MSWRASDIGGDAPKVTIRFASYRIKTICVVQAGRICYQEMTQPGKAMLDNPAQRLRRARLLAGFASAADLARRLGVELPTYRSHENGNRGFGEREATIYGTALGCSPAWLLFGDSQAPAPTPERAAPTGHRAVEAAAAEYYPPDQLDLIPIKSAARGGEEQEMALEPIGFAPRPYGLRGVKQAYAVYVVNDSMTPRYRPGITVHVNPWKTPRPQSGVVVYKRNDSVLIKEFVRQSATELLLRQYNPPEEIRIPLADVRECHVVVGTDESAG